MRALMLTGARPSELMQARWQQITGGGRLVHLAVSKTGPRFIYLGNPAVKLLETVPRQDDWIFPGQEAGRPLPSLKHLWARIAERAQLPAQVRLYDATRHNFITRAAGLGVPLEERKILSGHAPSREAHFKYLHQVASDGSLTEFGRHLVRQADQVAEAIAKDLAAGVGLRGEETGRRGAVG